MRMTPLRLYHEVHKLKHMEELSPPHKYVKITEFNINNIEHIKLMTLPEKMLLMNQIVHHPECYCGQKPVMIHARHKRYLAFGRDF